MYRWVESSPYLIIRQERWLTIEIRLVYYNLILKNYIPVFNYIQSFTRASFFAVPYEYHNKFHPVSTIVFYVYSGER